MIISLDPQTFRENTDPHELAWIRYEWITAHLDARGLGDAIRFVPAPEDPDDWRTLIRALARSMGRVDRSEVADLHGELEKLKVQSIVSATEPASIDRLLTVQDVARRLNVDESWVYEAARSGKLEVAKLGKYRRFTEKAVADYLKRYGGKKPRVI